MNKLLVICMWLLSVNAFAQDGGVEIRKQRSFHTTIPAGNYSGITWLGGNTYAVVNDKAAESGFHLFTIDIDTITGNILHASEDGFRSSGMPNRDEEGICLFPSDSTVFIGGEADNEVLEYALSGIMTGRKLKMPSVFKNARKNAGLESLTYQQQTGRFWITSESPLAGEDTQRLQCFNDSLVPAGMWFYKMDAATEQQQEVRTVTGISAMTALPDGRLLLLEREIFITKKKIGSSVKCTIYVVNPQEVEEGSLLEKTLLTSFQTKINLTARSFANYEGMCLGPRLADGRQVLVLICDSQDQYKGYLKDWLKTIVIP